jgi:hypothetical protein
MATAKPMGNSPSDKITVAPKREVPVLISAFQRACSRADPRTASRMGKLICAAFKKMS